MRVAGRRAAVAWCLEIHDLVLSKCAAGRDRDWVYAREALKARLVEAETLLARAAELPVDERERDLVRAQLQAIVHSLG